MVKNILIVGVGGQGTLLASKIMGAVFTGLDYDVKVSEVHGMSQRGGSVVTYVRYGEKVFSPVIEKGEADILISFEQLEAARWVSYLKPDGIIITNTQKIDPMPVIMGKAEYPENILEKIENTGIKIISADALEIAEAAGSAKAVNMVLLGMAAKFLHIDKEVWLKTICDTVPEKTKETNATMEIVVLLKGASV
jgi:indolepyruvate ferredoxin oxidoreductase beta subunit